MRANNNPGMAMVAALLLAVGGCGSSGGSSGAATLDTNTSDAVASDTGSGEGSDASAGDAAADTSAATCSSADQLELYERRIKPLVDGSQPSSCNQCHLSGVDLGMYVQSDPCQTMACLQKQGMVDFASPKDSKILAQIKMAKPQSTLITQDVIDAEYQGFLEWITYASSCMEQTCGPITEACKSPSDAIGTTGGAKELLGGCTEAALGELFRTKIYGQRGRCSPCHLAPGTKEWPTTHFFDTSFSQGDGQEAEFKAALYSMYNIIGIGALDLQNPEKSILLLNPLDPKYGGLPHAGHIKFANKQDKTYLAFLAWIQAYADCKNKAP